jgi:hypothetical protein
MRRYIRHPSDIPIEYKIEEKAGPAVEKLTNVSLGGLSFSLKESVELGRMVRIRIPVVKPVFEAFGRVVWCDKAKEGGYEVGVELLDKDDAYRARMIEQVCHIEHYKKEIYEVEGRRITGAQAAQEWIEKYAADFPRIDELEAS